MAQPVQMILPKGIVINSDDIYAEIAAIPYLDSQQIGKYWAVYTTTFRRLIDPTAERLEYFWWHVWGSDRRNLSGQALAKIFEEISTGPTFVPLRGPPNRWEGPPRPMPRHSQHESDGPQPPGRPPQPASGSSRTTKGQPQSTKKQPQPATEQPQPAKEQPQLTSGSSKTASRPPQEREKEQPREIPQKPKVPQVSQASEISHNLTPSSSRPPPPHPILKKPRGPSNSGPRPTARFVSPHASDEEVEEDEKKDEAVPKTGQNAPPVKPTTKKSEGRSSANSASPAKMDKKPATAKKFAASTTASKRRPVLPRRHSSQSSTGSTTSDVGSREGSSMSSKYLGPPRPIPKIVEQGAKAAPSRPEGCSGSSVTIEEERPTLSAKAAGKRAVVYPKSEPVAERSTTSKSSQVSSGQVQAPVAPMAVPQTTPQHTSTEETSSKLKLKGKATDNSKKGQDGGMAADSRKTKNENVAPPMARSSSNPRALLSRTSVPTATSSVAVSGIIDFDRPQLPPSTDDDASPFKSGTEQDTQPQSILASRFTPTQPNPNPAPLLGRTKSQLTLLMERDTANREKN